MNWSRHGWTWNPRYVRFFIDDLANNLNFKSDTGIFPLLIIAFKLSYACWRFLQVFFRIHDPDIDIVSSLLNQSSTSLRRSTRIVQHARCRLIRISSVYAYASRKPLATQNHIYKTDTDVSLTNTTNLHQTISNSSCQTYENSQ